MSVAEQLGLADPGTNELMHRAQQRWPSWCRDDDRLGVVPGPREVPAWSRGAGRAEADEVLHALASLAASDGGDDRAAAAALCLTLLPAAVGVAHELRGLGGGVDAAVASQLWVEARTFPWRRLRKVAANIRANTRAGVLRQHEDPVGRPVDRTWHATRAVDPSAGLWEALSTRSGGPAQADALDSADELLLLLRSACEEGVISDQDRSLLLSLVEAAGRGTPGRCCRGGGGLMSDSLSEEVGRAWGVAPVTVRRRTRRSVLAVAQACRDGRLEECA